MNLKHNWKADRILSDIKAEVMSAVLEAAAYDDKDFTLLDDDDDPHDPSTNFSRLIQIQHPARSKQIIEDSEANDESPLINLVREFHSLSGYCSFVPQAAFQAALEHRAFSHLFFTGKDREIFYHQAAIIEITIDDKTGVFIMDPTFRQFHPFVKRRYEEFWNSPAYRLSHLNPALYSQIMAKGFAQLTRENAEHYLQCFEKFDPDYAPIPDAAERILDNTGLSFD